MTKQLVCESYIYQYPNCTIEEVVSNVFFVLKPNSSSPETVCNIIRSSQAGWHTVYHIDKSSNTNNQATIYWGETGPIQVRFYYEYIERFPT